MFDDRGQAYTLEGLVAAVLIASSVILGLQAVDVAPWTSGPDDDALDTLRTQGNDVLAAAADSGTATQAVTCLDGSVPETNAYLPGDSAATQLGPMLNETFVSRGNDYNVFLTYRNGSTTETTLVYPDSQQEPDNSVVTVSRRVVLYDNGTVYNATGSGECTRTDATLATRDDRDSVYLRDEYPDSPVYNVVEVRVEIW